MVNLSSDIVIYDPSNTVTTQIARADNKIRLISFFSSKPQHNPNVDVFSKNGDPILYADSISAARSIKLEFLSSAKRIIVVLQRNDLRSLELAVSAIKLVLDGICNKVYIITNIDIVSLKAILAGNDTETFFSLQDSGRVFISSHLDIDIFRAFRE